MSAKPSIPLRASVSVYGMVEKIKTEKECTQMEAVDFLLLDIDRLKKENEDLQKKYDELKAANSNNIKAYNELKAINSNNVKAYNELKALNSDNVKACNELEKSYEQLKRKRSK